MKRFLYVFIFIIILVLSVVFNKQSLSEVFYKEVNWSVEKVDAYTSSDLGFVLEKEEGNGISFKYFNNKVVVGECIRLNFAKNKLNYICDKLGLNITNRYYVGKKYIVEGYSTTLPYFIEGKYENVQIAVEDDLMTIGSPIIYGSY